MIIFCLCQSKKHPNDISSHIIVFSTENENIFILIDKNCTMFWVQCGIKVQIGFTIRLLFEGIVYQIKFFFTGIQFFYMCFFHNSYKSVLVSAREQYIKNRNILTVLVK